MDKIQDLTGRIRAKAERKLKKDIDDILNKLTDGPLISPLQDCTVIYQDDEGKDQKTNVRKFFWSDGPASKRMFEANIKTYIEAETTNFLEMLQNTQDVEELLNDD